MPNKLLGLLASALALVALPVSSQAPPEQSRWSQWRGPLGTGESPDGDPPVRWSEDANVRFKTPLPGQGLSSPVVWGERIFVLSAEPVDRQALASNENAAQAIRDRGEWPPRVEPVAQRFLVLAYSAEDGSLLWRRVATERVPHEGHYLDSSWACASPITDGELVYAHFGSNGTYAFTVDGEPVWDVDLGDMTTRLGHGEGSSPALAGDLLLVNWDHEGDSFLVALDRRTGEERWRTARPEEITSWSTPLIVGGERPQAVVSATGHSRGYDLATGAELWRLAGMTVNTIPTPVPGDGVVYLASGYRGSMLQAVDLAKASGDLERGDAVRWRIERDTPYVSTPLLYRDQLYYVKHFRAILSSVDASSGDVFYTERLPTLRSIYASPVAAAGRVYLFGRAGDALVLKAGHELEIVATNTLDDGFDATPAIAGDTMYVRGRRFLYALAED